MWPEYDFLWIFVFFLLNSFVLQVNSVTGSRHQTPDTADERIRDLPLRQQRNPYRGGPRPRGQSANDRRRMNDDEETLLDSHDSVDRGKSTFLLSINWVWMCFSQLRTVKSACETLKSLIYWNVNLNSCSVCATILSSSIWTEWMKGLDIGVKLLYYNYLGHYKIWSLCS